MSEKFKLPDSPKNLKIARKLTEFVESYGFAETERMRELHKQIVQNIMERKPFVDDYIEYESKGHEFIIRDEQNMEPFIRWQILFGVLKAALFAEAGDMKRMKDHFYASLEYAEHLYPEMYQLLIDLRTAANS